LVKIIAPLGQMGQMETKCIFNIGQNISVLANNFSVSYKLYYYIKHFSDNYMKSTDSESRLSPAKVSTVTSSTQVKKMVALYDYDPQELSPNVDAEVRRYCKMYDEYMDCDSVQTQIRSSISFDIKFGNCSWSWPSEAETPS
jgi:hypothetical protein